MEIQHEIDKLRREIEYHSKLYYVMDAPVISDYEFAHARPYALRSPS